MAIVSLLLINLLIAMMGNTYERIAEMKNEWMRQVSGRENRWVWVRRWGRGSYKACGWVWRCRGLEPREERDEGGWSVRVCKEEWCREEKRDYWGRLVEGKGRQISSVKVCVGHAGRGETYVEELRRRWVGQRKERDTRSWWGKECIDELAKDVSGWFGQ